MVLITGKRMNTQEKKKRIRPLIDSMRYSRASQIRNKLREYCPEMEEQCWYVFEGILIISTEMYIATHTSCVIDINAKNYSRIT